MREKLNDWLTEWMNEWEKHANNDEKMRIKKIPEFDIRFPVL